MRRRGTTISWLNLNKKALINWDRLACSVIRSTSALERLRCDRLFPWFGKLLLIYILEIKSYLVLINNEGNKIYRRTNRAHIKSPPIKDVKGGLTLLISCVHPLSSVWQHVEIWRFGFLKILKNWNFLFLSLEIEKTKRWSRERIPPSGLRIENPPWLESLNPNFWTWRK